MNGLPAGLHDNFEGPLQAHWRRMTVGAGSLELRSGSLCLVNTDTGDRRYSNAQIDDYQGLARRHFLWMPPLRLNVRARFSHPGPPLTAADDCDFTYAPTADGPILSGTAGFGFWNDPFWMTTARLPALPQAIWFFYASPPSNMKLALEAPGCGWKAATIDATRPAFLLLAPTVLLAIPLMNVRPLYRRLWPIGQRALGVDEAAVDVDMTAWHSYTIEWRRDRATLAVDGRVILQSDTPPRGPLGLVIWLDNQFMVLTPQGRLRHGCLAQPGQQWLELDNVDVQLLSHS